MNNKVKNIIGIIGLGVLMTSCAVSVHTTTGDITLLDNNGQIIREWDNSTIREEVGTGSYAYTSFVSLKNSGLNFIDESGETHYISGGIIIVDNIQENHSQYNSYTQENHSQYNPYAIYAEKEKVRKEKKEAIDPYDQDHQP